MPRPRPLAEPGDAEVQAVRRLAARYGVSLCEDFAKALILTAERAAWIPVDSEGEPNRPMLLCNLRNAFAPLAGAIFEIERIEAGQVHFKADPSIEDQASDVTVLDITKSFQEIDGRTLSAWVASCSLPVEKVLFLTEAQNAEVAGLLASGVATLS